MAQIEQQMQFDDLGAKTLRWIINELTRARQELLDLVTSVEPWDKPWPALGSPATP